MFKLDRKQFSIKTFEEADDKASNFKNYTPEERFLMSWQLTVQMYFMIDKPDALKMDKTKFEMGRNG